MEKSVPAGQGLAALPAHLPLAQGPSAYLQLVLSHAVTGAMASWNFPLEYTVWSLRPAIAVSLSLVKAALRVSGTRSAVRASSALYCSSSAVFPWAADMGSRDAPVACWEMAVHASAAVGYSPNGPEDLLGVGVAEASAVWEADDDGALPACGAEHALRARAAKTAATVRGRERFFKGHISG